MAYSVVIQNASIGMQIYPRSNCVPKAACVRLEAAKSRTKC